MTLPYNSCCFFKLSRFSFLFCKYSSYFNSRKLPLKKMKNKFIYNDFFENHFEEDSFSPESDARKGESIVSADLFSVKIDISSRKCENRNNRKEICKGEILFGIHPVYLALLQQKRKFYQLFIRQRDTTSSQPENFILKNNIEKMAATLDILLTKVNSESLNDLALGKVHQGVCLDASPLPVMEHIEAEPQPNYTDEVPLWLVLDQILDPMNVGAILRSAYYFGVDRIFTVTDHSCKLSPTVSKASSGAMEVMDIYQLHSLKDFISARKDRGWSIISAVNPVCSSQNKEISIFDVANFEICKPSVLILGNEGKGISPSIMDLCDTFITIYPEKNLHQGIDSLNVSVAAGVILHSLKACKHKRNTS